MLSLNKRFRLVPIETFKEGEASNSLSSAKERLVELLEAKNVDEHEKMRIYNDLLARVNIAKESETTPIVTQIDPPKTAVLSETSAPQEKPIKTKRAKTITKRFKVSLWKNV